MSDLLQPIFMAKRAHVAGRRGAMPEAELIARIADMPPTRGFVAALQERREQGRYGLIAEMKRASPSRGQIRADFDAAALAKAYQAGGAACLSVLTDTPYFQGNDDDLRAARNACKLPVLRKDFIIDPYQIYESRWLGADCILLIMAGLGDGQISDFHGLARELDMDVLVETHDEHEIARALPLRPRLLGINNRNLKTLRTDIMTTPRLAGLAKTGDAIIVCESGLSRPADLALMKASGITTFLIGESLLLHDDVTTATRNLLVDSGRE